MGTLLPKTEDCRLALPVVINETIQTRKRKQISTEKMKEKVTAQSRLVYRQRDKMIKIGT